MARVKATIPGGPRLRDHLSICWLSRVYPSAAVQEVLDECGCGSVRRRALPAEVAMYFVIAFGLFRTCSTREVLRCLSEGLCHMDGGCIPVPGRSAITQARQRLGTAPFEALRQRRVRPLTEPGEPGAGFRGRRLLALDGTTLTMPDESGNREAFGVPGAARGVAAYPQARLTTLLEVGSRAVLAWQHGPYRESEMRQAERLIPQLAPGSLVLADRYFCSFPLWRKALRTGADLLWRVKHNMVLPVEQLLPDGSYQSHLRGSGKDRRRSTGRLPVRVIEYQMPESDELYRLITTVSPDVAAATELAALYHERWAIETAYDEIKTHMLTPGPGCSTHLRSKTPTLVRQEIDGILLAHYAVRHMIYRAARHVGDDPDGLSFTHAVQVVRRDLQGPTNAAPLTTGTSCRVTREIGEERAERSLGQSKPRGRRQKMTSYRIRPRGSLSRAPVNRTPKIVKRA